MSSTNRDDDDGSSRVDETESSSSTGKQDEVEAEVETESKVAASEGNECISSSEDKEELRDAALVWPEEMVKQRGKR